MLVHKADVYDGCSWEFWQLKFRKGQHTITVYVGLDGVGLHRGPPLQHRAVDDPQSGLFMAGRPQLPAQEDVLDVGGGKIHGVFVHIWDQVQV